MAWSRLADWQVMASYGEIYLNSIRFSSSKGIITLKPLDISGVHDRPFLMANQYYRLHAVSAETNRVYDVLPEKIAGLVQCIDLLTFDKPHKPGRKISSHDELTHELDMALIGNHPRLIKGYLNGPKIDFNMHPWENYADQSFLQFSKPQGPYWSNLDIYMNTNTIGLHVKRDPELDNDVFALAINNKTLLDTFLGYESSHRQAVWEEINHFMLRPIRNDHYRFVSRDAFSHLFW